MRLMSVILLALAVAACGASGSSGPNNFPDAAGAADGGLAPQDSAAQFGLNVRFIADPTLPGAVGAVNVTSAAFRVTRLEAIGDAGAPTTTTRADFSLTWNATTQPFQTNFDLAPPAIYSKVRLAIDMDGTALPAFEIIGNAMVNGTAEPFRIISRNKLDVEVTGYNVVLQVGGSADLNVIVDLMDVLAGVDFAALPRTSNMLTLDDDNKGAMDALTDRLVLGFKK